MKKHLCLLFSCFTLLTFPGCLTMKVEPIKIEVTVKIQVEKDLDSFFDKIDAPPSQTPKEIPS